MITIRFFFIFIAPFVFFFGFFGNVLAICVFLRKKLRKKNSSWFYFMLRLVSDTLVIVQSMREFFKVKLNFDYVTLNNFTCKIAEFSLYVPTALSAWSLVILSIDRFCKIRHPNNFFFLSYPTIKAITVIFLTIFNLFFNSPLIAFSHLEINGTNFTRECVQNPSLKFFWWMDLFNSILIPFVCMTIPTIITIEYLFTSKAKLHNIKIKDYKFAITSIILVIIFVSLNLPIALHFLIGSYVEIDAEIDETIYVITDIIYYMNYGIMFYVNCVVNAVFLDEFLKMVKIKKI